MQFTCIIIVAFNFFRISCSSSVLSGTLTLGVRVMRYSSVGCTQTPRQFQFRSEYGSAYYSTLIDGVKEKSSGTETITVRSLRCTFDIRSVRYVSVSHTLHIRCVSVMQSLRVRFIWSVHQRTSNG